MDRSVRKLPGVSEPADATRNRLTELALRRFLTQGYSKVSVDELSRALRISKKTLYLSYPSKRELLAESVRRYLDDCRRDVEAIAAGSGGFRAKLERLLDLVHVRFGWLEPHAIDDLKTQAPEVWSRIVDLRNETLARALGNLLEEGKREGGLRADLEADLVVEMMLVSLERLAQPSALMTRDKSASQMVEFVVRTIIDGSRRR